MLILQFVLPSATCIFLVDQGTLESESVFYNSQSLIIIQLVGFFHPVHRLDEVCITCIYFQCSQHINVFNVYFPLYSHYKIYYMCEGASNHFKHHKNSTVHPFLINFLDPSLMVMAIRILYVVRCRLVAFCFRKIVTVISVRTHTELLKLKLVKP